MYSYLMSLSLMVKSKGTEGITTSDIVDECSRPLFSVSGTLITLCTPDQHLRILQTSWPCTLTVMLRMPLPMLVSLRVDIVVVLQPIEPQKLRMVLLKSSTNREDQDPPAAARNSSVTSWQSSYISGGTISPMASSFRSYFFFSSSLTSSSMSSFSS